MHIVLLESTEPRTRARFAGFGPQASNLAERVKTRQALLINSSFRAGVVARSSVHNSRENRVYREDSNTMENEP